MSQQLMRSLSAPAQYRSPDATQWNPGGVLPDYVTLHPGYSSEAVGLQDTSGLRLAAHEPAINAQPFRPGAVP